MTLSRTIAQGAIAAVVAYETSKSLTRAYPPTRGTKYHYGDKYAGNRVFLGYTPYTGNNSSSLSYGSKYWAQFNNRNVDTIAHVVADELPQYTDHESVAVGKVSVEQRLTKKAQQQLNVEVIDPEPVNRYTQIGITGSLKRMVASSRLSSASSKLSSLYHKHKKF